MDLFNTLRLVFVVLALVVSFWITVVPETAPMWLYYAAYPIAAIGGGAAISLILERA